MPIVKIELMENSSVGSKSALWASKLSLSILSHNFLAKKSKKSQKLVLGDNKGYEMFVSSEKSWKNNTVKDSKMKSIFALTEKEVQTEKKFSVYDSSICNKEVLKEESNKSIVKSVHSGMTIMDIDKGEVTSNTISSKPRFWTKFSSINVSLDAINNFS